MTIFRTLFHSTATRSFAARSIALGACLVTALTCAAPAGALVTKFGSAQYGVQQRNEEYVEDGFHLKIPVPFPEVKDPATFENVSGRPVVHGSNVYASTGTPRTNTTATGRK